ncbi:hypothetical protein BX666DRAFT_2022942 [Dichotomocladium elegans]|nr:hypothetical protein BX666DRAFT_2022942 [Dichotomocladium elegans]
MASASYTFHSGMSPPGPRMANHFWSDDNTALNTILDRLQKSKRTCETVLKMFEKRRVESGRSAYFRNSNVVLMLTNRAHIEQEYGERLLKLSQIHLSGTEESHSTFSELLESVPTATEAAARAHIDLAQQIHHLLEAPLVGFIKEQKAVRKMCMQEMDQIQNLRYMHLDNVKRARNAYLTECANLEEVQKYASDPEAEEVVQMKQKVATVDQEYKLSLGILESVTASWIEEWRKSCNVFQELEEKKLNFLGANVYTIDDQSSDRIRAAYDNLDILCDMNQFIRSKGTGTTIPVTGIVTETPKYTSYEDTEDKPKPTIKIIPRKIHEINIPVVDEELRSVNDQLRKLPSMREKKPIPPKIRTPASPINEVSSVSPIESSPDSNAIYIPPPFLFDEKHEEQEPSQDQLVPEIKPSEKALPSLPVCQTITNTSRSPSRQLSEPIQLNTNPDDSLGHISKAHQPQSSPMLLTSAPDFHPYYQYNAGNVSSPHLPTTVVARSAAVIEGHNNKQIPVVSIDFDDQEALRKGKKKNKGYSGVFPFLKKKSETHFQQDSPGEEKTPSVPRFSLGGFRGSKKEPKSPMASQQQSPHSPSYPGGEQDASSLAEKAGQVSDPSLPAQATESLEYKVPIMEYVKAQWSYDAKIESEITFTKNDVLAVYEKKRDGWWDAQIVESSNNNNINSRGLVPGNFMTSV